MKGQIKRVIVDLDLGTDDYLGLLILLYAEKIVDVKIDAILCTLGNTTVDNVAKNVIRLLEIVKRTDIPVYKGAEKSLILPSKSLHYFNGKDGFADLEHEYDPDTSIIKDTPAAVALHSIVTKYPSEVSLLCLGPLTNLALAIKLFSDTASKIKDVWLMGGNYTGVENCTSAAEFNFKVDPEAAHIALECLECPIFILPWEPCLQTDISMEWRFNVLGDDTPALKLLTRAEKKVYGNSQIYNPCDAFLCFCYLNPEVYIMKQTSHHATVELHSGHTRGQVVLDHLKQNKPNVIIIEKFHETLFKDLLLELKHNL